MALTNAEKQKRWRERRNALAKQALANGAQRASEETAELRRKVAELEERLRNQSSAGTPREDFEHDRKAPPESRRFKRTRGGLVATPDSEEIARLKAEVTSLKAELASLKQLRNGQPDPFRGPQPLSRTAQGLVDAGVRKVKALLHPDLAPEAAKPYAHDLFIKVSAALDGMGKATKSETRADFDWAKAREEQRARNSRRSKEAWAARKKKAAE